MVKVNVRVNLSFRASPAGSSGLPNQKLGSTLPDRLAIFLGSGWLALAPTFQNQKFCTVLHPVGGPPGGPGNRTRAKQSRYPLYHQEISVTYIIAAIRPVDRLYAALQRRGPAHARALRCEGRAQTTERVQHPHQGNEQAAGEARGLCTICVIF